jgi:hypothetical protein
MNGLNLVGTGSPTLVSDVLKWSDFQYRPKVVELDFPPEVRAGSGKNL